ncbi:rhodanese-like domain-containing protein [Halobacillus litoralis]|uniref:rhodanese-like domain-containing protein n=1 Tax=Halobacillus litoralis TaxID=45668 RepID=UPI001CD4EEC1|nr:rhodanese-like domain-containing protein [Halobacillus litoralis]MCA0972850.1 rhodanese-like domain-containing protein [Halobacillus litoralis]
MILLFFLYSRRLKMPEKITADGTQNFSDFCVIDVRDYISAHRSPYPGADNIPLSYLKREWKKRSSCDKNILLIADDQREARLAAGIIKGKKTKAIYYTYS